MGNESCLQIKEKKQEITSSILNDIFKFRLNRMFKFDHFIKETSDQTFKIKANSSFNYKNFILIAENIISESHSLVYNNKFINANIYNNTIYPDIEEDKKNSKLGHEKYLKIMNNLIDQYIDFRSKLLNKSNCEDIKKNNGKDDFPLNNSISRDFLLKSDKTRKIYNLSEELEFKDYINKESIRIKKDLLSKDSNKIEAKTPFIEKEFDIIKNKYLELSIKNRRKSLHNGEILGNGKNIYSSHLTNISKRSGISRNESYNILNQKNVQNLKLFEKSTNELKIMNYGQKKSFDEIKNQLINSSKNRKVFQKNGLKINTTITKYNKNIKTNKDNIYSHLNNNESFRRNKSNFKYNKNFTPNEEIISLRIDIRNLMENDLKEELLVENNSLLNS